MKAGLDIRLMPGFQAVDENMQFTEYPQCRETLLCLVEYYTRVGFMP
jgi:hypothetical protein